MKHIIKWDPNAPTVVRGCKEPYVICEEYKAKIESK